MLDEILAGVIGAVVGSVVTVGVIKVSESEWGQRKAQEIKDKANKAYDEARERFTKKGEAQPEPQQA